MTECSKCGQPVLRWRDAAHTRRAAYCHDCHAAYMRANRPKHSELTDEQRKRANARAYAKTYLQRGFIQREPCEVCGEHAEMHHDDYDQPLDVRWLCRTHHLELHRNQNVNRGTSGDDKPDASA